MLTAYQTLTAQLLQNPAAPTSLYPTALLTQYINIARGQLAGESRCIRIQGTIATVIGQRAYSFANINVGNLGQPAQNGVQGVIHVRAIRYVVGQGFKWMRPRSWPWFDLYKMNNPVPVPGAPQVWAQYSQGAAGPGAIPPVIGGTTQYLGLGIAAAGGGAATLTQAAGNFYIDPIPDAVYTLVCDCVCYPLALTLDTDFEAIPFLWTDAIPFYAAYYALLSAQTSARMADAERYLNYYKLYVQRARDAATPDVNRYLYEQVPDPTALSQMGLSQGKAATQ